MCDPAERFADLPEVRRTWELLEGADAPTELERFAAGSADARAVLSDWLAERGAAPPEPLLASVIASRATPREEPLCERTFYQLEVFTSGTMRFFRTGLYNTRGEVEQAAEELGLVGADTTMTWLLTLHQQGRAPVPLDLRPFVISPRLRVDWKRAGVPRLEGDLDEDESILVWSTHLGRMVGTRYGTNFDEDGG
jgi:hypothetical protein